MCVIWYGVGYLSKIMTFHALRVREDRAETNDIFKIP